MTTKPIKRFIPKPANASRPIIIRLKKARVLWSGPGNDFNKDYELLAGTVVTMYDAPTMADMDKRPYKWADLNATSGGWIGIDELAFEPVETLPPDPILPPAPPPPVVEPPKPPAIKTFNIPLVMTVEAESEEVAALLARYVTVTMDAKYRQLRYDAELMRRIDEI